MLGNLHIFCPLLIFFKIYNFKNFFQEYNKSVRQYLAPHFSGLIWFQTVCKVYQQTTLASEEFYWQLLLSVDNLTFANRLDSDQDRQNVGPDLSPNSLTL